MTPRRRNQAMLALLLALTGLTLVLPRAERRMAARSDIDLARAIRDGANAKQVEAMVKDGADVNANGLGCRAMAGIFRMADRMSSLDSGESGKQTLPQQQACRTPLIAAAAAGKPAIEAVLIEHGAYVNGHATDGTTPLLAAAAAGDPASLRLLLHTGADVHARRNDGASALLLAAYATVPESLQVLLDAGANANEGNNDGTTALMAAALGLDPASVRLLLAHGADLHARNKSGATALALAALRERRENARILLAKGANPNQKIEQVPLLTIVAMRGSAQMIELLLAYRAHIDAPGPKGGTALMVAANKGNLDAVKALQGWGSDINMRDINGETALMYAAEGGHADVVRFLVEKHARRDLRSQAGITALDIARSTGDPELVALLDPDAHSAARGHKPARIRKAQRGKKHPGSHHSGRKSRP